MNKNQLAKTLGVSLSTVDRWLLKKDFPAKKVGKEYDFDLEDVLSWIEKRKSNLEPISEQASDIPIIPANLITGCVLIAFTDFLVKEGKLDPKDSEGLIFKFLKKKPVELREIEQDVNETFKLLEKKKRYYS